MSKPNLLLCFDAFGTLFKPKKPIIQQYSEVARRCGVSGFNEEQIQSSFKAAFKDEARQNPNYGKATGLGATKWWTNVIHKTFNPLLNNGQSLPGELAPKLLHRFSSSEGYATEPNLVPAIKALRQKTAQQRFNNIVVGVVTNSDDRVPDILSSFGLNVSHLRYGSGNSKNTDFKDHDIDFHCMSYDVGVEKPDKLIFEAAKLMLAQVIATKYGNDTTETGSDIEKWLKIYVGDEYEKDIVGSLRAGWNPVLLAGNETSSDIPKLEDVSAQSINELFEKHPTIRTKSIERLAAWLMGKT